MNYYTLLGVGPDATRHEIESAYAKLLRKRKHTGRGKNSGVAGDIKNIRTAYTVLSDPDLRRRYDEENGFPSAYISSSGAVAVKRGLPVYIVALLVLFAVVGVCLFYSLVLRPPIEYHKALSLIESGRYMQAYHCLERLGDYRDCAELKAEILQILQKSGNRRAISAGGKHTVGLKKDGTVVAVGDSRYGQLNVDTWQNIIAVSAGSRHTVGLRNDGTVAAAGDNQYGQLDVTAWRDIVAVSAGGMLTAGVRSDGTLVIAGQIPDYYDKWFSDHRWKDFVDVSAGILDFVVIRRDGTVFPCGYYEYHGISQVSSGIYHTLGLQPDGTVRGVGSDQDNRLNIDEWTDIIAVSAGFSHSVGLRVDGTVVAVGTNYDGQLNVSDWTNIIAVSGGSNHTVGLREDGTVVAVGSNASGQLNTSDWKDIGLPDGATNRNKPVTLP